MHSESNMGRTVVFGNYEWDEEKNRANIKKHNIGFEEVLPVFDDPLFWERFDSKSSASDENRYIGIGKINGFTIVTSCYTDRNGRTRIINARIATKEEEKDYERWCESFYG